MRLQEQYNRVTVVSTFFILLIAAASYFFILRFVLISQLDDTLKEEEAEVYDYVKKYDTLPDPNSYKDQHTFFNISSGPVKRKFSNIDYFDSTSGNYERSRQIVFPVSLKGQYYKATVVNSAESTANLVWFILSATIALIILLTLILFFTNRFLINKLWKPFQATLATIKEFNVTAPEKINFPTTPIKEFSELNESIRMMTRKVIMDYQSLKDFTNHASHEIQTPLAVMRSKLDILIQQPELGEKSMNEIQGMYQSLEKVSRLTQSLLLIARIDNNQYTNSHEVSISEMLAARQDEIREWSKSLGLSVEFHLSPFTINMNTELAEILVNNLLVNAARHNIESGKISVESTHNTLVVSNSGQNSLNPELIYKRFYKSSNSAGSGLGLAIVKKITEQFGLSLKYEFSNGQHIFSVSVK